MDEIETIAAFAALAQTTRLDTFRLLVAREPEGVPAGELARLMAVPQNTMSAHLGVLLALRSRRAASVTAARSSTAPISRACANGRRFCSRIAAAGVPTFARR